MIRRIFSALWNVLRTPWVAGLQVTMLLLLLVWFGGPHLAFAGHTLLGSINARLIAALVLIFGWGLCAALSASRQRTTPPDQPEQRQQPDRKQKRQALNQIKTCVQNALRTATRSDFYGHGRRSPYSLPWYLLLGTGNSGKTSSLLNSGLKFPLNEQADSRFHQIEATEQCEALYGSEAVFIDTPGAYTESDPGMFAHTLWTALLSQLLKVRPANPLNGIIVCVSMRDVGRSEQNQRAQLARRLRTRLDEVLKRLRHHVPVYLVFTKCDTIPGFRQFFAHLARAEREQIFGCPGPAESRDPGWLHADLRALVQTLTDQTLGKIHRERNVAARGALFRFPQEFAALGPRLEDFITETFGPGRYHGPVLFRGCFFTSALAADTLQAAASPAGEWNGYAGSQAPLAGPARGFFLLQLFERAIVPEAKLAAEDKDQRWSLRLRRHGLQLAAAALFLFAAVLLGGSFMNNYSRLEDLADSYTAFANAQHTGPAGADAKAILPELEFISATTHIYNPDQDSDLRYGLGLYQGRRFEPTTRAAYLGTLNARLMPALRAAAADSIAKSLSNVNELKAALQAYLMLCQPEHIRRTFLTGWLNRQWSDQYPGQTEVHEQLKGHLNYLLANGIVPMEPDPGLIDRARRALLKTPLETLVYQRLQEEAEESGQPPFTFRAAIGESPFSGDTYAIPILYTRKGYEEYLVRRCPDLIRELTAEKWVFGMHPVALSGLDVSKVHKEVRRMYFRDYIRYWSQGVQALEVRTPKTMADAHNLADQLTGGIPPAVLVLRELRANTSFLAEAAEAEGGTAAATEGVPAKGQPKPARKLGAHLAREGGESAMDSGQEAQRRAHEETQRDAVMVRQYFVPFAGLLTEEGNPNPTLKAANDTMAGAGAYFAKLLNSDNREKTVLAALLEIAEEKDDTLQRLESSAERLPSLSRRWYGTVASGGLREMLSIAANSINRAYHEQVISLYDRNLRAHYPFNVHAERDVNLEDFTAFFRGGGVLDTFHATYLHPFVTRSGTLRMIMGRPLPLSGQAVAQLQRANRVQEAFFMSGRELGINFLMEPYALDATLKQVSLSHAGKTLKYCHGPVQGAGFTWPTANGQTDQAILDTGDLNGVNARTTTRGEWALFRLLQRGSIKRQEGNTCLIELQQHDKWAQFLIQFRNKANPFDPAVCSFALPEALL